VVGRYHQNYSLIAHQAPFLDFVFFLPNGLFETAKYLKIVILAEIEHS